VFTTPLRIGLRLALLAAVTLATLLALPPPQAVAIPYVLANDGLHRVAGLDLTTGGATDTQLSDSLETLGIWTVIDGLTPPPPPGIVNANSKVYNIGAYATDTEVSIDYVGSGDFGVNRALSTIGTGFPMAGTVEDVSVRARTYLAVPIGNWTISIASDDGRRLQLTDAQSGAAGPGGVVGFTTFSGHGEQTDSGSGTGFNFLLRNATTAHDQSVGTFSVTPANVEPGTNIALIYLDGFYFERGTGGGSFEISIRNALDTTFGGSGEGWTLLADNTFGWRISSTPITVTVTPPANSFTWDGSTDDWRAGAGADTHWEPPALGNTLYATIADDATVNAGQANVASSNEAALNLNIGGTGTVNVAAGRTLTVDSTLTIGAGGTLANGGIVNALVVNSTGTVTLAGGSSLTASGALGNVDVLSGTASLNGFLTASTLDLAAGTTLSLTGGSLTASAVSLAGGTGTINTTAGTSARLSNISETAASNIAYTGLGTIVLPTANTYTGTTTIGPGVTVQLGNNASLGTEAGKTIIHSGGVLDIRGLRAGANGNELVEVAGTGIGGNGAIINTGGSQTSAFRRITLTGNATFRADARWDMRDTGGASTFDMGGFTLTKVGSSELALVNTDILNEGSVNVNQGLFRIEGSTRHDGPGTITVVGGATLDFWNNTQTHGPNLSLASGSNLTANGGGGPTLAGTVSIAGTANVVTNNNIALTGQVTGGGIAKTGTGRLSLSNPANNYTGAVSVGAGTLAASGVGSLGNPSSISVSSGATLEINNVGTPLAIPLILAGDGQGGVGALRSIGGSTTFTGPVTIAGTTVRNDAAGTLLTLAGPVTLAATANLTLGGAGDITITQAFGNGAVPYDADGIEETLFDRETVGGSNNPRTNIEDYRNATLQGNSVKGILTTHLHYNDDAAFDARAAALGKPGWDPNNGPTSGNDYSALWVTKFKPNENGAWGFRFNSVDDNASMWLDDDQNGIFESTADRFYERGCCGGSGDRFTVSLTAGQTYLLGFVMNDTGGGGYYRDMEFKAPSGAWTDLNPSTNPGRFQVTLTPNNSLVKTGAGTLTLNGNNNYNGTTTVQQGTLLVNGTTSGQGDYTVQAGATLGGGGSIGLAPGARINILAGGYLAPGFSPGTFTVNGDFTMGETSGPRAVYDWELGSGVEDLTVVTGDLTLNRWTLLLLDAGGESYAWQKHYLFTGFTSLSGPNDVTFDVSQVPQWMQYTNLSDLALGVDGGGVYLTGLTTLPEPATVSLLALGALALLRRRRRRR